MIVVVVDSWMRFEELTLPAPVHQFDFLLT